LARSVGEIMNPAPNSVREAALVAEALEILNRTKITALFVVVAAARPVNDPRMPAESGLSRAP
jgi:hypothetical protein